MQHLPPLWKQDDAPDGKRPSMQPLGVEPEPNGELNSAGQDNEPAPPPLVGWVWRQPARLSAHGKHLSLRAPSKSGGLANDAWGLLNARHAKHTQHTFQPNILSVEALTA